MTRHYHKLCELLTMVQKFCEDRDWDQYHNPKDLSIGIVTEAAELIEHFRFKSIAEMEHMLKDSSKREKIAEELADILFFILRFAQKYEFDLTKEFIRKMSINESKYPIDKFKGSNKKYTEA